MIVTVAPSIVGSLAPTVRLELPDDDVSSDEALDLVKRALVAYGFQWANIFAEDE